MPNDFIHNENKNPSLGQISFLADIIQRNENLQKHFNLENAFEKLEKIKSIKQLKYFHALILNKRYFKLNELMLQFGFEPK